MVLAVGWKYYGDLVCWEMIEEGGKIVLLGWVLKDEYLGGH